MKRAFAALAAVVAVGVLATSAFAITDGELDGNGHPYVGLMVAQGADGNPLWRCSGTLMSPTVFQTAGHCTEAPAAHVEIWFAAGPIDNDPDYVSVATGGTGCAIVRGRVEHLMVYIDEQPSIAGLDELRGMPLQEIHRIEVLEGGAHVRVYTKHFILRLAQRENSALRPILRNTGPMQTAAQRIR